VPEVLAYLDARRALPYSDLRIVGDERALYEFYLLQRGSLAGCAGKADAAIAVAAQRDELRCALKSKRAHDRHGGLVEHVADQLATRRHDYAAGLTQMLRQSDAQVFKKYSQMKLQMKREALEKLNRRANEMAPVAADVLAAPLCTVTVQ